MFAASPADACGFFRMTDRERKLDIGWLINSASIEKGGKRLAALYLDIEAKTGLRVVTSKKVVFDIAGDKVRRYGVDPFADADEQDQEEIRRRVIYYLEWRELGM